MRCHAQSPDRCYPLKTSSQTKLKAHHTLLLRFCTLVLSGPLALLLRTNAFQVTDREVEEKREGRILGITMVQLASSCPPCSQTGAILPLATEANISRYLYQQPPALLRKRLTACRQDSFPSCTFAGPFRYKTLKNHQSPFQAEPLGPPVLPIHSLTMYPPNT